MQNYTRISFLLDSTSSTSLDLKELLSTMMPRHRRIFLSACFFACAPLSILLCDTAYAQTSLKCKGASAYLFVPLNQTSIGELYPVKVMTYNHSETTKLRKTGEGVFEAEPPSRVVDFKSKTIQNGGDGYINCTAK
jgi:hypothetical protein